MAKKKNVSNSRPVATTSVASTRPSTSANAKSSSTSSLVNNKQASSADSNPQKTQQQQQSATAKIIAKTKAAVESASEQSALDRVTAIKVDAALKRGIYIQHTCVSLQLFDYSHIIFFKSHTLSLQMLTNVLPLHPMS